MRSTTPPLAIAGTGSPDKRNAARAKETAPRTRSGAVGVNTSTPSEFALPESAHAAAYLYQTLRLNGIDLAQSEKPTVPELFRLCRQQGTLSQTSRPLPGDLVFFHNTNDLNRDGRNNDWYSYVALVETVASDGTIALLGYSSRGVNRFWMNLENPEVLQLEGRTLNTALRKPHADDAPYTQYYAGQLFADFCSVMGSRKELVVIDRWAP